MATVLNRKQAVEAARFASIPDEDVFILHAKMKVMATAERIERLQPIVTLPDEAKRAAIEALDPEDAEFYQYHWPFHARPNQLPPPGDWLTWLIRAGRGFGKTRTGAEWVRSLVCGTSPLARGQYRRIALVAETAADARDVMVEGDSGILGVHPPDYRPLYEPSKRRLTWPNGAVATLYNATEPDQLRGPQHDLAWADELAKWAYARETWDQLQFGLRVGKQPRQVVTTTPRPIPIIKEIIADPKTVETLGSTIDNINNLAPTFVEQIMRRYEGTRLGRQEIYAEILDDVPGALWIRAQLDEHRVEAAPELARIVVAVDPSGTHGVADEQANDVGIVVVGVGVDGRGYVLADRTCNLPPEGWGRRAIDTYHEFEADRIIAETNFGGAMVEAVIRSLDVNIPFSEVRASRGKIKRAEPIAALYEQGRVSHVGGHPQLEDQMMLMTSAGFEGDGSPDRADALVWGLTDLMLNTSPIYPTATAQFTVPPFNPPPHWPRAFAMKASGNTVSALWGAYDKEQDTLYVLTEHNLSHAAPSQHVAAIQARGKWIPGVIEGDDANLQARRDLAETYAALGLDVVLADQSVDAGITDVLQRVTTARLKVSSACQGFLRDYRAHRRDEKGEIIGGGLMDCVRILCRPATIQYMRVKPADKNIRPGHRGDRRIGGY